MRTRLILLVAFVAATAFAADPPTDRLATAAEADALYLGILNSQPYNEALEMLTDVGVKEINARELLDYLAAHMDDLVQDGVDNAANLCRNPDGQFSNPMALAQEIRRQRDADHAFQASLVNKAKEILGVASLRPIWQPHMKDPGIVEDVDVVEWILDGRMKPADAIARACEVTRHHNARFSYKSDSL